MAASSTTATTALRKASSPPLLRKTLHVPSCRASGVQHACAHLSRLRIHAPTHCDFPVRIVGGTDSLMLRWRLGFDASRCKDGSRQQRCGHDDRLWLSSPDPQCRSPPPRCRATSRARSGVPRAPANPRLHAQPRGRRSEAAARRLRDNHKHQNATVADRPPIESCRARRLRRPDDHRAARPETEGAAFAGRGVSEPGASAAIEEGEEREKDGEKHRQQQTRG
jgi:hypothetical protein